MSEDNYMKKIYDNVLDDFDKTLKALKDRNKTENDYDYTIRRVKGNVFVSLVKENGSKYYELYNADHPGFIYDIEYVKCSNDSQLLQWIEHLRPKIWVTKDHIIQFVTLYLEEKIN